MYKDTFAADITKNKAPAELFDCIGNFFYDLSSKESYQITGIGKDRFICTRTEIEHDYDDESPWGYTVHRYLEVKFTEHKNYVYSLPPTPKQKAWLENNEYDSSNVSGVEAWHIIHDAVEEAKRIAKRYQEDPNAFARQLEWMGFKNNRDIDSWLTNGTFEMNGMDIDCDGWDTNGFAFDSMDIDDYY